MLYLPEKLLILGLCTIDNITQQRMSGNLILWPMLTITGESRRENFMCSEQRTVTERGSQLMAGLKATRGFHFQNCLLILENHHSAIALTFLPKMYQEEKCNFMDDTTPSMSSDVEDRLSSMRMENTPCMWITDMGGWSSTRVTEFCLHSRVKLNLLLPCVLQIRGMNQKIFFPKSVVYSEHFQWRKCGSTSLEMEMSKNSRFKSSAQNTKPMMKMKLFAFKIYLQELWLKSYKTLFLNSFSNQVPIINISKYKYIYCMYGILYMSWKNVSANA